MKTPATRQALRDRKRILKKAVKKLNHPDITRRLHETLAQVSNELAARY